MTMGFPLEKYGIIYADPPWTYKDKCNAGQRGASHKYDTMTIDDIKALPVQDISDQDCVLFMWATMPLLPEAFEVMKAWGFQYKTVGFTWIKLNKIKKTPFFGMGSHTRACAEICLLGVKGKPKRIDKGVHSVIQSPIEAHSKKPDETRDRIVRLMGDIPRIELFARQRTPGWDVWGDGV